jgi:CRISPR-associated protein Cmr1
MQVKALHAAVEQHRVKHELDVRIDSRLITPQFGGGFDAGENDPLRPISPKGIRGQLRFWWRVVMASGLLNPTGLSPVDLMSLREAEIFGSTELPSPFDVSVAGPGVGIPEVRRFNDHPPYGFRGRGSPEAYALFPAIEGEKQDLLREGLVFQLVIHWCDAVAFARRAGTEAKRRDDHNHEQTSERPWPEPWKDLREVRQHVDAALWAWLNFGGVGARTRRGLGAVATDDARFSLVGSGGRFRHVIPIMTIFLGPSVSIANAEMVAWGESLKLYQGFRQNFRGGRHPKRLTPSVPGRSFWPEPDSLRDITGCALRRSGAAGTAPAVPSEIDTHDHSTPIVPPGAIPGFPRALLGLPIIFHFSDGPGRDGFGRDRPPVRSKDPATAQLVPAVLDAHGQHAAGERMASPVITRPMKVQGRWCPAVIILRASHLNGLEAHLTVRGVDTAGREEPKDRPIPHDQIVNSQWATITDPRWPLAGQQDALSALESYLTKKGFHIFPGAT